ncbi:ferredoxin [Limibacillus sp. MBR-115]|jgi:ferredoxin|uniref:ferredoxin n=1 Tax=Limibacillus sp. MBR-115 TaxID=3156465 RepID=UPI00339AAC9A
MKDDLTTALAEQGLLLRGGFRPGPETPLPSLPDGRAVDFVAMIGNAGPEMWRHFVRSPEYRDSKPDPMNRWTKRVVDAIALRFGSAALYPSDGPPYYPFQRWAQQAEAVFPSPLGILVHPRFGLWHAYRAALLFTSADGLALKLDDQGQNRAGDHPCESCADKPCLSACPVGAFTGAGYRVDDCAAHVGSAAGHDCRTAYCRARRACPVGLDYIYDQEQAAFHMAAFLSARPNMTKPLVVGDEE